MEKTAGALLDAPQASGWLERLDALLTQVRELTNEDIDSALYLMLQTASQVVERYSACHGLFCCIVGDLCARWLEWSTTDVETLRRAALTMNIGMQEAQDVMARQIEPLSLEQKRLVNEHPAKSERLLRSAGVEDVLWLETVLRHHELSGEDESTVALQPALRLAQLLQRIDVYTAKLSRRRARAGTSATIAARDACLGPGGKPDAIGVTMLRVLGLYPPGSFVQLANGEIGVVTGRGVKAHTPLVACLRREDGALLRTPTLRDTSQTDCAVRRSLTSHDARIVVHHERTLMAWWAI